MALERHSRLHHEWRPGAAYFVTWRLYGSLPVSRWSRAGIDSPGVYRLAAAATGTLSILTLLIRFFSTSTTVSR